MQAAVRGACALVLLFDACDHALVLDKKTDRRRMEGAALAQPLESAAVGLLAVEDHLDAAVERHMHRSRVVALRRHAHAGRARRVHSGHEFLRH